MVLPKIKKRINAFLLGDDGKISKQSLLAIGAILSTAALSSLIMSKDVNAGYMHYNDLKITQGMPPGRMNGTHSHHGSHSSHSSHGSHGSHGSHASHGSHGQW